MSGLRTYFAINLKNYYASAECAAQGLDPVGKTLRLALDGTTGGPGVQKKKALVISLGDIEALT